MLLATVPATDATAAGDVAAAVQASVFGVIMALGILLGNLSRYDCFSIVLRMSSSTMSNSIKHSRPTDQQGV